MKTARSPRIRRERSAVAQLIGRLQAIWQAQLTLSERVQLVDEALTEAGPASQYLAVVELSSESSESNPRRLFRLNKAALKAMETSERGTVARV